MGKDEFVNQVRSQSKQPRRSLILAGGGLKVGFQAGVLEVWLDEAGLSFDHADGASGGCFNLTMYCQGMSGRRIADNWRNLNPFLPVDLNWEHYWKLSHAPSLFTYDRFREKVLPLWGIDWNAIRRSERTCTFNVFNFSRKHTQVITQDKMNEDYLIASVSLPMWFPPVTIHEETYFDAAFITDANVEEAIRRGAEEIWAIWTVSTRDEWHDGFTAQYFQIIESTADTHFFHIWRRIEESNRALSRGESGEFERKIELKLLQAEVPVHYLFNLSRDRMAESVNLGVETAREWCRSQDIPLQPRSQQPLEIHSVETRLRFTEEMKGFVSPSESDEEMGFIKGRKEGHFLRFHLDINIHGVNRFITDPQHQAEASGWVEYQPLGGKRMVRQGVFNLMVHHRDPNRKHLLYRLYFEDSKGNPFTLSGRKDVEDDPGLDLWSDTTTLATRILHGHVEEGEEAGAVLYASGILKLYLQDFLKQLTTFRVDGPTIHDRVSALNRFGSFFFGKLWDVYGRRFVEYGPF